MLLNLDSALEILRAADELLQLKVTQVQRVAAVIAPEAMAVWQLSVMEPKKDQVHYPSRANMKRFSGRYAAPVFAKTLLLAFKKFISILF